MLNCMKFKMLLIISSLFINVFVSGMNELNAKNANSLDNLTSKTAILQQNEKNQRFLKRFQLSCQEEDDFDFISELMRFYSIDSVNSIHDSKGRSLLMIAISYTRYKIATLLLLNNADIGYQDAFGNDAWFFALKRGDKFVELLDIFQNNGKKRLKSMLHD